MSEMSIFDGVNKFELNGRKLRLIELFAGYGSQAYSLKRLGIPFESYAISEWATKSIQAYKDMHHPEDNTDYAHGKTDDELRQFLYGKISKDYSTPLDNGAVDKMKRDELSTIYNNMMASHNLGSVVGVKAADIPIEDKDKYAYMLFYSFPCQDISNAGLSHGFTKGSGTRSGLLWEVERLLFEWDGAGSLPDILVMENVPQVVGSKSMSDFSEWISTLDALGYKSFRKIINATEFGIPQNRERCFMISLLGDYYYDFPEPIGCKYRLRDICHKTGSVDANYYLNDEQVANFVRSNPVQVERERERNESHAVRTTGRASTTDDHCWDIIIEQGSNPDKVCQDIDGTSREGLHNAKYSVYGNSRGCL